MKKLLFRTVQLTTVLFLLWWLFNLITPIVTHPETNGIIPAPQPVLSILKRSCFDCHSNETKIGWIQRLPIASLIVKEDVQSARSKVNFTNWNAYTPLEQDGLIYYSVLKAVDGHMPPERFLWIHPNAKITNEDKAVLNEWLNSLQPQK